MTELVRTRGVKSIIIEKNEASGAKPRESFIKFCDNTERLVVLTNTCLRVGLVKRLVVGCYGRIIIVAIVAQLLLYNVVNPNFL